MGISGASIALMAVLHGCPAPRATHSTPVAKQAASWPAPSPAATGGVLGGLNLNATGSPTQGAGANTFGNQLAQNLQAGAAKAVVNSAIYGTSLEGNLKAEIKGALISTAAAQTANAIGDQNFDAFTNKVAHAIAGCAAGAANTRNGTGCSAGALGAAVGESAAELYGAKADTVQFASMVAGIAAAVAKQDVNLAAAAGGNAAANNFLNHTEAAQRESLLNKQRGGKTLTAAEQATLDNLQVLDITRDLVLRDACKTAGDACDAARRGLNAALASYQGAGAMYDTRLTATGNAGVVAERDQSIAVGNDPKLATQSLVDSLKEFAYPQMAGYAAGAALGAYVSEARAIYGAIRAAGGEAAAVDTATFAVRNAELLDGSGRVIARQNPITGSYEPLPNGSGLNSGAGGLGKLIGSTDALTAAEKGFVNEMVAGGKTVQIIPTSTGRTADFLIDGTQYELKTMSNVVNQTSDGLSKSLSSTIMDARGQSGIIIIDARGQPGMTPEIAERGIVRGLNADKEGKVQAVSVITSQGTVYIPRTPK